MATSHSLKLLLEYARKQTDDAAIGLGKLNLKQREAEKTLQLLIDYRTNYQTQFMQSASHGISPVEWRNFKIFVGKLDTAIQAQQALVTTTRQHAAAGSTHYHKQRKRMQSYATLSHRAELTRQKHLQQQEQRLLDEHTSHKFSKQPKNSE